MTENYRNGVSVARTPRGWEVLVNGENQDPAGWTFDDPVRAQEKASEVESALDDEDSTGASNNIKRMTIIIETRDDEEPETTLEEVLRLVREGYTSGFNHNEDAAFHFSTEDGVDKELAW